MPYQWRVHPELVSIATEQVLHPVLQPDDPLASGSDVALVLGCILHLHLGIEELHAQLPHHLGAFTLHAKTRFRTGTSISHEART